MMPERVHHMPGVCTKSIVSKVRQKGGGITASFFISVFVLALVYIATVR
jgi:hypothetical protein